jgi:DNA-binding NarL/FixJ family response regulator
MAEGRSNRGIGAGLGIEDKTVEYHVTQILGKLGIEHEDTDHRRVLAVIMWLRRGG